MFDHTVWAFASDGDLEEGVEDNTGIAFTEDVGMRLARAARR